MSTLLYIMIAVIINSIISLIGILFIRMEEEKIKNILMIFVALSAGTLFSVSLYHLLPESIDAIGIQNSIKILIIGFLLFFFLEKILRWHHCHEYKCKHSVGKLVLLADGLHNFIDGVIISVSFLTSFNLGILTTTAILMHELPQEIGDFFVLLYSGIMKRKALFYNFISQVVCVFGATLVFIFRDLIIVNPYVLSIAAGGFLYISSSDLIPEIVKEDNKKKSFISLLVFLLGVFLFIIW